MKGTGQGQRRADAPSVATPLRVAWLAPYNLALVAGRLPTAGRQFHPAPWIANGARALMATGQIDLHVLTYDKQIDRDYEFEQDGISFHVLRTRLPAIPRAAVFYRLDLPRFQQVIRRIDPHVVHGHGTENVFSYAAVRCGYPHVISMQAVMSELAPQQPRLSRSAIHFAALRVIERRTLARAERVLAEAPFVADLVAAVNPRTRTTIVGNIVSAPFFSVRRADRVGSRIMFVGSLIATKGVREAIAAFHLLAGRHPGAELHLVGTASERDLARLRAAALGGAGASRIVFRGFLEQAVIAEEYRTAAVMIAPTYYDTSPNAVTEALVAGVPVVASRVGGLPYILEEGRAGRLVAPRDVTALAEAIDRAISRPDETLALAARGQELARQRYSPETFVTHVMAAYADVCGAHV